MISWKKLISPPGKAPKDIKEWLGLITDTIKKLKGSENWYDDVSLLTSLSIVNDLETSEANKALSSEQGVVLNRKINELGLQVNNISDRHSLIINLKSLGLKEGNENAQSNTLILQNLIKEYPKGNRTFFIPKGVYYFNPIDLSSIKGDIIVRLKGESNEMGKAFFGQIATTIKTNMQDFIYDKRPESPGITFYVDDIKFYSYDGYNKVPTGVCFGAEIDMGYEYNFHFYNVAIHGFDYGFRSPGYSCGASGGENISLSTCHYGIFINKASHLFQANNVELTYNRVGIRFGHGGNPCCISNLHVANGYLGADKDNFDRFMVIHCKGGVHISNLYQEAYESSAQPEKTTIIDYEGWAYGVGPVIVENTPIAKPCGKGGLFFKGRTYLGAGPEAGNLNPISIYSGDIGHYPNGCVKFINCEVGLNIRQHIGSIFDVPEQSPGYDINGELYYLNRKIINKNAIAKVDSTWKHGYANITEKELDGYKYSLYNHANFEKEYRGFKPFDIRATKEFAKQEDINIKGTLFIEDTLSSNIDVVIGFLHQHNQFTPSDYGYKFYPITTLKGGQNESSFSFDFNIERYEKEQTLGTSIQICTKYKNNENKLNVADYPKIRWCYTLERGLNIL